MDEATPQEFEVGGRCVCEGHCGTVRYVGEVPPARGLWLGVEWDDPARGRHSGEHNGKRYFTCIQPGSGSFVRPKKVSPGHTFIAALKERYTSGLSADEELFVVATKGGNVDVEMVGAQHITAKQSQFERLCEVSLAGMLVASAGPPGEIKQHTPNVQSLDLSQNPLLTSWRVVADITAQLEQLHSLTLSENRQLSLPPSSPPPSSPPPSPSTLMAQAFRSLRVLFFNKIKDFSWNEVSSILTVASNLEEVHLCENRILHIPSSGGVGGGEVPQRLRLLNLEENLLADWSEIMHLQHLSNLKTLILNDNQLAEVLLPEQQGSPTSFPALESLSLSGNHIADWSSVNALNRLPALLELKFKGNPLLKEEPTFTARQLMIAHLSRLTSLNSSPVSERERQLAERYYVKTHGGEWLSSQASADAAAAFTTAHPRFPHLVEMHGLPDDVLIRQKPPTSTLKEGLISVGIRCPDQPGQREVSKKLPASMTVQKLKGLLQRLYKVDTCDQKLSYIDKRGGCEVELGDDLRQLSFYSIETGDTVLLRWQT